MLKIVRIVLAAICFLAALWIFAAPSWPELPAGTWIAKIQFVPALLSLNVLVIAGLVVATLLLGRVYCSVICPLGVYQDTVNRIAIWCSGSKTRKNGKFRYAPASKSMRIGFLTVFALLIAGGLFTGAATWAASLIEPYSAFGRMVACFVKPFAGMVNNDLAAHSAQQGNYDFISYPIATYGIAMAVVAAVTFVVVTTYAATSGRGYCNQVCPVGTVLGYLSKFSLLKPVINTDKCIRCGKCARKCKASCIDSKKHTIDYSRCVACMDCINACKDKAITYKMIRNAGLTTATDASRRNFVTGAAIVAGSLAATALGHGDGGLAPLKPKQKADRRTPLTPPGAKGNKWLAQHCTACQLCISRCPNQVLSASTRLDSFMQPVMDFSKGYCRPECTACSDVCPTGAILPIDVAEKSSIKIGTAVVDTETCISAKGRKCGRCAKGCPTGAIAMVSSNGRLVPAVNDAKCIGCGACEYHCPVGTVEAIKADKAAIHVEGVLRHHKI